MSGANVTLFAKRLYKQSPNSVADPNVSASWTKIDNGDVHVVSNGPLPDGTFRALSIAGDNTVGQHGVRQAIKLTANTYLVSALVKAGNKTILYMGSSTGTNTYSYFNLSTGRRGTVGANAVSRIKKMPGGWYLCQIRFTGTAAAHNIDFSPTDADASLDMAGGDATTKNIYLADVQVRQCLESVDTNNKQLTHEGVLCTDEGAVVVGGVDENLQNYPLSIAPANATATVDTPVARVQVIDATGAVGMNLSDVTAADGATAAAKSILIGGKDGTGKQQDVLVGADGRFDVNQGQIAGATINVGSGAAGATGTQRVIAATDSPEVTSLAIMDDWDESDRAKVNVNLNAGVAVDIGAGSASTGTARVSIATDDVNLVAANASLDAIEAAVKTDGATAGGVLVQVGGSDGTNAQIQKMGADGASYIEFNSKRPGENISDDMVEVRVMECEGYAPSATGPTVVNAAGGGLIGDEILAAVTVTPYRQVTISVYNNGGGSADDIDRIIIYGMADGTNWGIIYDTGTGLAWADGAPGTGDGAWLYQIENNSYEKIKVEALCAAADDTTVTCGLRGN